MLSHELVDRFRVDVMDEEEPQLWTDPEIYSYIQQARDTFCRLTEGLSDSTSSITELAVTDDDEWVELSPLIIRIRKAYLASTGHDIEVINLEDMARLGIRFDGRVGPVKYLIIGMEEDVGRYYPFPNLADTIHLTIDRYPLEAITGHGQALEIKDTHHVPLLMGVKQYAYLKPDSETFDKKRSKEFEADFVAYCMQAKLDKDKTRHKTRVTVYGGI